MSASLCMVRGGFWVFVNDEGDADATIAGRTGGWWLHHRGDIEGPFPRINDACVAYHERCARPNPPGEDRHDFPVDP